MWSLVCALECESVVSAAVESQESFFLKVSLPCQAVVSTHLLFTSEPHVRPTLGHFHLWTWGISWKRSEGKEVLNETEGTAKGSLWVTGIQTKDQSKKNKSLYFCWLFSYFFWKIVTKLKDMKIGVFHISLLHQRRFNRNTQTAYTVELKQSLKTQSSGPHAVPSISQVFQVQK